MSVAYSQIKTKQIKVNTFYQKTSSFFRRFDWVATFEGYKTGDIYGIGATEAQALKCLMNKLTDGVQL